MRILVTGSAGHLGEALMRTLEHSDHEVIGSSGTSTRKVSKIRRSITSRTNSPIAGKGFRS
jgi:nucleoside-diphosphate-sugar epimerase